MGIYCSRWVLRLLTPFSLISIPFHPINLQAVDPPSTPTLLYNLAPPVNRPFSTPDFLFTSSVTSPLQLLTLPPPPSPPLTMRFPLLSILMLVFPSISLAAPTGVSPLGDMFGRDRDYTPTRTISSEKRALGSTRPSISPSASASASARYVSLSYQLNAIR
jgi:hypothetical protein